jgi:N-acetylglutamate synthase-like GNAT family acetyltransferase
MIDPHSTTITFRLASPADQREVELFYKETGYSPSANPQDAVVLAESGGRIVGALRLVEEQDTLVLRGLRVREALRRKGVGSGLVAAADFFIGGRECFMIPFRHLEGFYARYGFARIEAQAAPGFLGERLGKYRQMGLDVILMARESRSG